MSRAFMEELLPLLRCPESQQTLTAASAELVSKLELARAAGTLRDRAGQAVTFPIEEGFVRADGALFFPIRGHIPTFISTEAIAL